MIERQTIADLPLFAQARTAPAAATSAALEGEPKAMSRVEGRPREPQPAPTVQPPCSQPALPPPPAFLAIIHVLRDRVGAERAIPAWQIAQDAGINPDGTRGSRERHVRELLELHLECAPWPIVADANGFYRPRTAQELAHYWSNLTSRALCLFARLRTTRRLATRAGFVSLGRGRWSDPAS